MSKALFVIKNYTNEMTCTCSNICMFHPFSNSIIIGGVSFDRIKRDYLIDYLRDFIQLVISPDSLPLPLNPPFIQGFSSSISKILLRIIVD